MVTFPWKTHSCKGKFSYLCHEEIFSPPPTGAGPKDGRNQSCERPLVYLEGDKEVPMLKHVSQILEAGMDEAYNPFY